MSNKNQVYLAGVLMYLVAGLAGYLISSYWVVGIASVLLGIFTAYKTFGNASKDDVYYSIKFDWISILAFAVVEVILTVCITVLKLELVGILGFVNLFVQAMGYVFVGYSIVRYTLEHTTFHKEISKVIARRRETTIIADETITTTTANEEVAKQVEEIITEAAPEYHEVEIVGEKVEETEIKSIELKVEEETEIVTPYMEEEI